jgi:predicted DNA-binding transcriptional regulator YafY
MAHQIKDTRRLLDGIKQIDGLFRASEYPNLERLSIEIEASPRTVQRYLQFMRTRLGVEIIFDRSKRGYGYSDNALAIPSPQFTEGELVALYIARPLLREYQGTPLENHFRRAFEKITCHLPSRVQQELSELPKQVSRHRRWPVQRDIENFEVLLKAMRSNICVEINYRAVKQNSPELREVHPYRLHFYNDRWYLIAYCMNRSEVRVFHLDRMKELRILKRMFERPTDFSLEKYFAHSLGIYRGAEDGSSICEYVIRFDSFAAHLVRGLQYHPTQVLKELPEGKLEMHLTVDASVELEEFILAFGEHAELISPSHARDKFKKRLVSVLAVYQGDQRECSEKEKF